MLFARNDQLMAQPFDPASGKLSGEAVSIAKGVMNDTTTWHMDVSAFSDKLLVLANGGSGNWQLVWVDRGGKQISTIADNLANLQRAALAPQDDRVALVIDNGQNDIIRITNSRFSTMNLPKRRHPIGAQGHKTLNGKLIQRTTTEVRTSVSINRC